VRDSELIEVELDDGRRFFAEASVAGGRDVGQRRDRLLLKVAELRETLGAVVRTAEDVVTSALAENPPSKVAVEFGVKLSARTPGGVVLGQVGGEASLVVKLEWDRSSGSPDRARDE
jgi:hypothetical protein